MLWVFKPEWLTSVVFDSLCPARVKERILHLSIMVILREGFCFWGLIRNGAAAYSKVVNLGISRLRAYQFYDPRECAAM